LGDGGEATTGEVAGPLRCRCPRAVGAARDWIREPDVSPPSTLTTAEPTRDPARLLVGSRLLAGLPAAEAGALAAEATRVRPRMRELVYAQGGPMADAYFPVGGVFSLVAELAGGGAVETLTVGSEGMLGLPAVLGLRTSPTRAICQISGWAIRVPTARLVAIAPPGSVLYDRLVRYAAARLTSLSCSVACSRLHSAEQRYARWVLATHDRVGVDEFPVTQEFLAQMLGVTRPTISLVGQGFQEAGLIHYAQGRLTLDDRPGLEAVACECYATVRAAFAEALDGRMGGAPEG
jgi:CRP-like cAMP-binding protein